jgi:hypothetical protein
VSDSFVPREFIGRARQFRDRVIAADNAVRTFLMQVRARRIARRQHSPVERPDVLIDLARSWKTTMPAGRISLKVDLKKKSLHIDELRAGESVGQLSSWGPDAEQEPGIGVIRTTFHIEGREWEFDATPLAIVSLHAIARRMQRAFNVTDDAILADLLPLAIMPDDLSNIATEDNRVRIKVQDGEWLGGVVKFQGDKERDILVIRTFL